MGSQSFKSQFGKRFRRAREERRLSRAALGVRLGISPKTIQSWEMGRTFIEDLSLIPAIEAELNVTLAYLLGVTDEQAGAPVVGEEGPPYGRQASFSTRAQAGPREAVCIPTKGSAQDVEAARRGYVAVPLVRPGSAAKPVADLRRRDVDRHCLFPRDWCVPGQALVAFRMSDSMLSPIVPLGSILLVDRRLTSPERLAGHLAALWVAKRGLRIRRLRLDPGGRTFQGLPEYGHTRGRVRVNPDRGDALLGRVVGQCCLVD